MELSRKINDEAKQELSNFLEIGTSHIINVKTPLDLSFVFTLQNYLRDQKELFYEKRSPRETPALSMHESILSQVEKKDVLLSYPFESMKPFIKMLNDAAEDPDVVSIKMTLYRVADRSKIIDALIEAAENGKEVVVLVELRARFDEANNIEMSHRLEDAAARFVWTGRLQSTFEALPDHTEKRGQLCVHHADWNRKLQRENFKTVHGPVFDYRKSGNRCRCSKSVSCITAGRNGG